MDLSFDFNERELKYIKLLNVKVREKLLRIPSNLRHKYHFHSKNKTRLFFRFHVPQRDEEEEDLKVFPETNLRKSSSYHSHF